MENPVENLVENLVENPLERPWIVLDGIVQAGHGVASGRAVASPYPAGTIALQLPFFQHLGLDLSAFFPGTLNISIAPHTFELVRPDYCFRQVAWTDRHPPEDFSFVHCRVVYAEITYDSLIYYPHPETKRVHFQPASLLEVLAPRIAGIGNGDRLQLQVRATALAIQSGTDRRKYSP